MAFVESEETLTAPYESKAFDVLAAGKAITAIALWNIRSPASELEAGATYGTSVPVSQAISASRSGEPLAAVISEERIHPALSIDSLVEHNSRVEP